MNYKVNPLKIYLSNIFSDNSYLSLVKDIPYK